MFIWIIHPTRAYNYYYLTKWYGHFCITKSLFITFVVDLWIYSLKINVSLEVMTCASEGKTQVMFGIYGHNK